MYEKVVKRADQVASQSRDVGEWMDIMLSQVTRLLSLAYTISNNLYVVRKEVDSTIEIFSQELEIQEKDFEAWLKYGDYDLDDLIQNSVCPSQ